MMSGRKQLISTANRRPSPVYGLIQNTVVHKAKAEAKKRHDARCSLKIGRRALQLQLCPKLFASYLSNTVVNNSERDVPPSRWEF